MTADIVVGGLGGDGPIVTAGLGLSGAPDPNAMRAVLAGSGALSATLTVADNGSVAAALLGSSSLTAALTGAATCSAGLSGASSLTATLTAFEEISVGEMAPTLIEMPWMLAAAVDEALMAAFNTTGASMSMSNPPHDLLTLAYDGFLGYDYQAGYDQIRLRLSTATISPYMPQEVSMSASSTARPSMSPGQPATGLQPVDYDGSIDYDYPLAYDADGYVPAVATMTPA